MLDSGVQWREVPRSPSNTESNGEDVMAYVIKRTVKRDGKERFTGVYQAEDGTYKSAGTFDPSERALEVAEAQERHRRLKLAEVDPAVKATITIEEFTEKFLREADIEPNSKQGYSG